MNKQSLQVLTFFTCLIEIDRQGIKNAQPLLINLKEIIVKQLLIYQSYF